MPTLNKNSERWIFLDNLDENQVFEYSCEQKKISKKTGKEYEVVVFLGSGDKNEYLVTKFNIENYNDLVHKIGEDDKVWATKKFRILAGDRKDFKLELI